MFRIVVCAAVTTGALMAAAPAQGADLARFVGRWSCRGNFSNGAPIATDLSMEADTPSVVLLHKKKRGILWIVRIEKR
jgi:hypothetical protein